MRILLSLDPRVNYPIPHTLHQHFPELYLIKNQKYQLAGISPEDLTETCHSFGQKKHHAYQQAHQVINTTRIYTGSFGKFIGSFRAVTQNIGNSEFSRHKKSLNFFIPRDYF
jgi:hypothetical protein